MVEQASPKRLVGGSSPSQFARQLNIPLVETFELCVLCRFPTLLDDASPASSGDIVICITCYYRELNYTTPRLDKRLLLQLESLLDSITPWLDVPFVPESVYNYGTPTGDSYDPLLGLW